MLKILKWTFRLVTLAAIAGAAWFFLHGPTIAPDSFLVLDVGGSYSEGKPTGAFARVFDTGRSMSGFTSALRKVRHDGRIAGVIVRIDSLSSGWAQAYEIRSALSLVKAAGKRVVAELAVELAPATKEIYIASVADSVYVEPAAAPLLAGLAARAVFFGGVWPNVDVNIQVEKIGDYKSAGEEIGSDSMSPAHREMLGSILDDLHGQFVRTIADARNLSPAEIDRLVERGVSRPADLVAAGLANAVRSHSEVLVELGGGTTAKTVTEQTYSGVTSKSLGIGTGPMIAVIHANGGVSTGRTRSGTGNFGSRTIAEALGDAAEDADIAAIVLRVASPGGSPAASDEIWLAVREAAKRKPVVASLGDVAASGGYYLASAADRIVAAPGTLTGSIGVVFFKPDVSPLMNRVGLHSETIARGRYARLFDLDKGLDASELELVRTQLDSIYGLFLERVATGRKKKAEEIDRVGGGRVWTGQQAFDRGLVDEIGTTDDAIRAAANAAGIHDIDKVDLVHYPKPGTFAEQLASAGSGVATLFEPAMLTRLADVLGNELPLLSLQPGVQAMANGLPVIE